MPRSIWRGAISFGLVNVPVKLYSAVSKKTVRFNQLHEKDNQRIQMKRWCPGEDEEVPYEEIVKGYEISPDQYVVITPEELEGLDPKKTRTIDIEDFVDLDEIDPLYYEHPYYLVPDTGAAKPYKLLLSALQESNKVAIARVVIRSKEYLTAIRPAGGVLTLGDDAVRGRARPDRPARRAAGRGRARPPSARSQMAMQLIESLTTEFDPTKYRDNYRERVLDLIERKAGGEEITIQAAPEEPAKVPDLMAALEASLAAAKKKPAAKDDRVQERRQAIQVGRLQARAATAKKDGRRRSVRRHAGRSGRKPRREADPRG